MLAAVKVAKLWDLGPDDAIITVATDGAALYPSERAKTLATTFAGAFDDVRAAEVFARHLVAADTDHTLELTEADRRRIFNLGYFTWVEQQGVPTETFRARRTQSFWHGLRSYLTDWDAMIAEFNARVAAPS